MPFKAIREFVKLESSAGIILFLAAIIAIILDNSPFRHYYQAIFTTPVAIQIGAFQFNKPFLLWINDGFMAIFFLLVGLEIKREILQGELNHFSKSLLPAIAAFGGMLVPALIYILMNWGNKVALQGWAIPVATDIAFSLGILSLLKARIAPSLHVFLTALAIFDDIGAIIVIAIFYTLHISLGSLLWACPLVIALLLLNRLRVMRLAPYFVIGILLWVCVLKSGVHATLAGILLAIAIPVHNEKNPKLSPLHVLERQLHPWVAFGILPLFAFANAGVSFSDLSIHALLGTVPLGIVLGLFVGKQLGIYFASATAIKLKAVQIPQKASFLGLYGVSVVAGVGFTMSLFIGTLAFDQAGDGYAAQVRLGVIVGSLLSGMLGYLVLRVMGRGNKHGG